MPKVTLKVPSNSLETAKKAAQSFDPDVGGYLSFDPTDEDGYHICSVDVSDEYYNSFILFKDYPELLLESIKRDFTDRFPNSNTPTIDEVKLFCSSLIIA